MISQPKGTAGLTPAEFYSTTRTLLIEARRTRDEALVRRASIRINGDRFDALSDDRQEDLRDLYKVAAAACGMGSMA